MNNCFVETSRLLLRRLEEADFPAYAAYAVDDEMSRMMGRAFLHAETDIRQNFDWLKDKEPRCYGIVEKANEQLIGNLNIVASRLPLLPCRNCSKRGQTLSFCIRRESQRKGYAAEAIRAVIAELFDDEHFDFVQCGCYSFNTPSRMLQERLGFQFLANLCVPTPQGEAQTIEHILWNPRRTPMSDLNAYFKSVIDQDTASVVLCDLNHTIVYMNPAAIRNYARHGGAALIGRSLLHCHNASSNSRIQEVVDWFAASPEHNIIYTYHNEKQNKDVYMVACGMPTAPSSATTKSTSSAARRRWSGTPFKRTPAAERSPTFSTKMTKKQKSHAKAWLLLFFLSVPLVAEGVDLVGKSGKVLVGPSLVVFDDPQQALACADQALENRGGAAGTLTGPTLDPHSGALLHTDGPLGPMTHCAPL